MNLEEKAPAPDRKACPVAQPFDRESLVDSLDFPEERFENLKLTGLPFDYVWNPTRSWE